MLFSRSRDSQGELSMTDTPNPMNVPRPRFPLNAQASGLLAGLSAVVMLAALPIGAVQAQGSSNAPVTHTAAVATKPADAGATAQPAVTSKPVSRLAGRYFVD